MTDWKEIRKIYEPIWKETPAKYCVREKSKVLIRQVILDTKNPTVLDLGCGPSNEIKNFCKEMSEIHKDKGYAIEYIRCDIQSYGKKDINIVDAHELEVFFGKDKFDIVIATHIFEHVFSPFIVLDQLKKVMKKDGILIVQIPPYTHGHTTYPSHIINLTEQQMEHLLRLALFEPYWHNNYNESRAETFLAKNLKGFK